MMTSRYHLFAPNPTRYTAVAVFFIVITCMTGCSVLSPVGNFIGQRYENAVAYFNTYYNGVTAFDEAESEVILARETARLKDQPVKDGDIPNSAKQKFTLSIEKFSRLLSLYPTSKWVDKSLFMIGKAYYYQADYVKAERKFRELISQMPSSDLVNSAGYWLGRSLAAVKRNAEAKTVLTDLIQRAEQGGDREIAGEASFLLGSVCLELTDSAGAISAYSDVMKQSGDEALKAEAQLALADILAETASPDSVLKEYTKVRDYDPDILLEYHARLNFANYLVTIGRTGQAVDELNYLLSRPEFIDYNGLIKYTLGYAYQQEGNLEEAYPRYVEVDTVYPHTDASARSYFQRAVIAQKDSGDYSVAMRLYDKARSEYPQSPITQVAAAKSENLKQYLQLRVKIRLCDSLLGRIPKKPDSTSRDSLGTAIKDSTKGTGRLLGVDEPASEQSAAERRAAASRQNRTIDTTYVPTRGDSLKAAAHLDSINRAAHERTIERAALSAHGRKFIRDSVATAADTLRTKAASDSAKAVRQAASDTTKIITDRIIALYDLGALMYIRIGQPDSALHVFEEVLESSPPADIGAETLFTMGQIYLTPTIDRKKSADSLYDTVLVRYPRSKYAQEIRRQRGIALLELSDEEDARRLYVEAEKTLNDSDSTATFHAFREVVEKHPKTEYGLQARYTIGWLFENRYANNDSAEAWYSDIAKDYPTSVYAKSVKGKLDEVTAVQKRQQAEAAAKARSEAAMKRGINDTTQTASRDSLARSGAPPGASDSSGTASADSLRKSPGAGPGSLNDETGRRKGPVVHHVDSLTLPDSSSIQKSETRPVRPGPILHADSAAVKKVNSEVIRPDTVSRTGPARTAVDSLAPSAPRSGSSVPSRINADSTLLKVDSIGRSRVPPAAESGNGSGPNGGQPPDSTKTREKK